jgi:hypothetical protein
VISDRDLVTVRRTGTRVVNYSLAPMPRAEAERYVSQRAARATYDLEDVPSCRCCGEVAWPNLLCTKHQDRQPCAAEGCRKTMAAKGRPLRFDTYLCGEHWRAFVPPGSPGRRAFNRLARIAKRAGYKRTDRWPPELEARWWRLWAGVMRRVRREPEGHIDEQAVRRMFGWDDE